MGQRLLVQHEVPESLLVLHTDGGSETQVRMGGRAWNVTVTARRFDYYPAGYYESYVGGPAASRAYMIRIPAAFEYSVLEEGGYRAPLLPRFQFCDRRLEALVEALAAVTADRRDLADAVILSAAIVDRMVELVSPSGREAAGPVRFSPTVRRLIKEYLDMNLGGRSDIDRIAFLTGLARTQSAQAFRQSFGMPLHKYLVQRRMDAALQRLADTDMTVTQLAHELGFSSHAHFTTVFRQHMGMTPSSYRADQRFRTRYRTREPIAGNVDNVRLECASAA